MQVVARIRTCGTEKRKDRGSKWHSKSVFRQSVPKASRWRLRILFHVLPNSYYKDEQEISVLAIEEESASFILPFIHDIYPYFYERYYSEENHLPFQMWEKIIQRLKSAREAVIKNPYGQEFASYAESFNLYVLAKTDDEMLKLSNHDSNAVLFAHRFDIAQLYDTFIRWSEAQLQEYSFTCEERMFNMQGP